MNELLQHDIKLAILNETWITQESNKDFKMKPYETYEKRRWNKVGGGLAILTHPSITASEINTT